jgi:cytochrome c6
MMKRMNAQIAISLTVLGAALSLAPLARAQATPEAIYASKCAACHGPDGSGSAMGKKLGALDFHSVDVQKQSDAALSEVITKGREKMPAFGAKIKPDDVTKLVAYIRTLPNKK